MNGLKRRLTAAGTRRRPSARSMSRNGVDPVPCRRLSTRAKRLRISSCRPPSDNWQSTANTGQWSVQIVLPRATIRAVRKTSRPCRFEWQVSQMPQNPPLRGHCALWSLVHLLGHPSCESGTQCLRHSAETLDPRYWSAGGRPFVASGPIRKGGHLQKQRPPSPASGLLPIPPRAPAQAAAKQQQAQTEHTKRAGFGHAGRAAAPTGCIEPQK